MAGLKFFVAITALFSCAYAAHFQYVPSGKKNPCIIMDADFSIQLEAIKNNTVLQNVTFTSEQPITVTGTCEPAPSLKLEFSPDGVKWTLDFTKPNNTVFLDRQLQFVPKNVFSPSTTTVSRTLTFLNPKSWKLASNNDSFFCNSTMTTKYIPKVNAPVPVTFTVTTTIKDFKVQAFDVQNGTYSPSQECSRDFKTTTPMAPTTTPPPPDNSYYVTDENVTCIALTGEMSVDIRYEKNTSDGVVMSSTKIDVPRDAKASGSCHLTKNSQNLIITFFKTWSLEFVFQNDTAKSFLECEQDKQDYHVESIILTYVIDHAKFPGSVLPEGHVVTVNATGAGHKFPKKSTGKGFYVCKSDVDLKLNDNSTLTTWEFYFKAFNDDNNRHFNGTASECEADKSSDDKRWIIIVGAVVGGIAFIVIVTVIAVFCQRKRKPNYESLQ